MKRIPLTQGQHTPVDDADYEWLSQWKWTAEWSPNISGYYAVRRARDSKTGKYYLLRMHRLILGLKRGDKRQANHINHFPLDNRRENIRIVSHAQNQWNRKKALGCYFHKGIKRWIARIRYNGEQIYLGCFRVKRQAVQAYHIAKRLRDTL